MKIILFRPYYGANIHGDMAGDFGVTEYLSHVLPDLSLVYASSLLPVNDSVIIDANALKLLPHQSIHEIPKDFDILILKTAAPTIKLDIEFARFLFINYPHTKIVLTGRTAIILKKWIQEHISADIEIPEQSTIDYISYLLTGKKRHVTLNDLPVVDYSRLPYKNYVLIDNSIQASIFSSCGCIVNCIYCPYSAQHNSCYEERSLSKLGDDLENILSLGIRNIQFRDQYFTANKERTMAVCRMIRERGLKFNWICETKVDNIDNNLIEEMLEAGLDTMCFGIETASRIVHDEYQRPVSNIKQLHTLIEFIHNNGAKTIGFYMVGFPKESLDDLKKTFELAQHLSTTYATFHIWTPYLGTKSGDAFYPHISISPDIFPLFKNRMYSGKNNIKELKFQFIEKLAEFYFMKYIELSEGLEKFYKHSYYKISARNNQMNGFMQSIDFFKTGLSQFKTVTDSFQELL